MRIILTIIVVAIFLMNCSEDQHESVRLPLGQVDAPSYFDPSPNGDIEENDKIINISYERLLRQVVAVDSAVKLVDETSPFEIPSLPKLASPELAVAFHKANKDIRKLKGPFDVYARISLTTGTNTSNQSAEVIDTRASRFIQLSGVAVTYSGTSSTQFRNSPNEIFTCSRIVSRFGSTSDVLCLLANYDANTNVFTDHIFELRQNEWIKRQ